ncbi:MAG: ABC transporter substrate-binding protein [Limnochordia bacterium]|jgi:branched-chain amino acid transport system substrate-binding protein|nr:ABC transporter substrate-binding protein [Bacillota bacterium]
MRRIVGVVLAVMLLATCSVNAAEPVYIGAMGAITGGSAISGEQASQGLALAEEDINAAGGVLGRPVKIIMEDSRGLPTGGVTAARKLIFQDNVVGIIGCHQSTVVMAIEPLIRQEGVICMAKGSADMITAAGNPWIVRVREYDTLAASAKVRHAIDKGYTRFAIFHNTDQFGEGGRQNLIDALARHGLEPVAVEAHNTGDKDFTAQLLNIRRADPEVLIVWTHGDEHALICRQVAQLLPDVQYYGSMAITQWSSIQMAEGTSEGAYTTSPYSYLNPDPDVQAFVKRHEERYGRPPETFTVLYYDSAMMLAEAIRRAGTTDRAKVLEELKNIKGWKGVSGIEYSFDEKGEAFNELFICRIENQQPVIIEKVSVN